MMGLTQDSRNYYLLKEDGRSQEIPETIEANDLEEDDDLENSEDDLPLPDFPFPIPTLHKLKSASAEMKGIPKVDEELMIKDNKITPITDDDKGRESNRIK
jgi:hypothetical protein